MSIKVSAEDAKKLLSVLEDMDGDYSPLTHTYVMSLIE